LLYYAGGFLLLIAVLFFRRPRRGMRLRLGGGRRSTDYKAQSLRGKISPDKAMPRVSDERTINVIFNFNGESWDAYEVFGLPAGSGMAVVETAYRESLARVEESSRAFLHAAYKAIADDQSGNRRSG
jgi:hypothetical protein